MVMQQSLHEMEEEKRWTLAYEKADEPTRKVLLMEKAHRLKMREIAKQAEERRIDAYMAALNARSRCAHSDSSSDDALSLLVPLGLIGLGLACTF